MKFQAFKKIYIVLFVSVSLGGCGMQSIKVGGYGQPNPIDTYVDDSPCSAVLAMEEEEKNTLGYQLGIYKSTSEKTEEDFDEDQFLTYCEYGLLKQACGDCDGSIKAFTEAQKIIDHFDNKAKISASEIGKNTLSVIINDNTMSYTGETYERVLIRSYQALNYIGLEDYNNARIEIDEAYHIQEAEKKKIEEKVYEKSLEDAKSDKDENENGEDDTKRQPQIGWENIEKELESSNTEIDVLAERATNSYENGFTYYLSSIVDELNGNIDSAYIDLKDAHDVLPNNDLILSNLIRLAKFKGSKELNLWVKKQKKGKKQQVYLNKNLGKLIIVFHNGVSPYKDQIKIPIPLGNTILFTAYPILKPGKVAFDKFILKDHNGKIIGQSSNMFDLNVIMAKSHQEKRPAVIARMVTRAVIKGVATNEIAKRIGLLGAIATSVLNYATENADVRSWKSLPAQIDVLETMYKPGNYQFTIDAQLTDAQLTSSSQSTTLTIPVKIKTDKPTIINIFVPNKKLYYPAFNTSILASQEAINDKQAKDNTQNEKEKM